MALAGWSKADSIKMCCYPLSLGSILAGSWMWVKLDACPEGQHFKISKRASDRKSGHPQSAASALGPEVDHAKHVNPFRAIFQFLFPCGSCGREPPWLSKLDVLWPHLLRIGVKTRVPNVGCKPFTLLREKLQVVSSLPAVNCHTRCGVCGKIVSKPLLPTFALKHFLFVLHILIFYCISFILFFCVTVCLKSLIRQSLF